jgi:hypothetical protein
MVASVNRSRGSKTVGQTQFTGRYSTWYIGSPWLPMEMITAPDYWNRAISDSPPECFRFSYPTKAKSDFTLSIPLQDEHRSSARSGQV